MPKMKFPIGDDDYLSKLINFQNLKEPHSAVYLILVKLIEIIISNYINIYFSSTNKSLVLWKYNFCY